MSDPPGMKRSHDDSTSPHPKRHNTEQSNIPPLSLNNDDFIFLKSCLQHTLYRYRENQAELLDVIYSNVLQVVPLTRKEERRSFVEREVFKTNVLQDAQAFLDVVGMAAGGSLCEEDLRAVIFHGMCTRYGTDRIMN